MAKKTALQLVNKLMNRINQNEILDIGSATGHSKNALNYLNEALQEIYNYAEGNWYTLLATRQFKTSLNGKITLVDYSGLTSETISITYNGVTTVLTGASDWTASTSNEVTAESIKTAINNSSPLNGLVAERFGVDVVVRVDPSVHLDGITAIATSAATTEMTVATEGNAEYSLPTDYGTTFVLKDMTNNRFLTSEYDKIIDAADPDEDSSGTPLIYSVRGDHYRLYPKPSSVLIFKEAYWKLVNELSANADLYTLPEFCEPVLLKIAEAELWYYLDKTQKGDRARSRANVLLEQAKDTNENLLNRILKLDSSGGMDRQGNLPIEPVFLGSNYEFPAF
jgi:hypothetical protein